MNFNQFTNQEQQTPDQPQSIAQLTSSLTVICLIPIFIFQVVRKDYYFKDPNVNLSYCTISVLLNRLTGVMLVMLGYYATFKVCIMVLPSYIQKEEF